MSLGGAGHAVVDGAEGSRMVAAVLLSVGVHAAAALWWEPPWPARPAGAGSAVEVRLLAAPASVAQTPVPPGSLAPVAPAPTLAPQVPARRRAVVLGAVPAPRVAPSRAGRRRPALVRARRLQAPAAAAVGRRAATRVQDARASALPTARGRRRAAPASAPGDRAEAPPTPAPVAVASARRSSTLAVATAPPGAGAADRPPRPLAGNVTPRYPSLARRRGQQGRVLLRLDVGTDGKPARLRVVLSSGSASLDAAAREAVARWRFEPAIRAGVPVTATVEVPVVFRLDRRG